MEEREIDLLDLLADILRHWKGIIVCFLIGAVLSGGFSYIQFMHEMNEACMEIEKEQTSGDITSEQLLRVQAELALTGAAKMAVLMVVDDEQELAAREQYAEISVLMNLDAYDISQVELVYELAQADMQDNHMLGTVYEDLLNGVGLYDWLEEQTGIPSIATRELIAVVAKSNKDISDVDQNIIVGNDSMKVTIIHAEEAKCAELAQAVKAYIESLQEKLTVTMGEHEVSLISENVGSVMDMGVLDKQIANRNTCLNLQNSIEKAIDGFTTEQEQYYNLLTGNEEVEMNVGPSVSLQYVVMGGVVFAFLYAAWWMVLYAMNGKLRAGDELQSIYQIAHLGLVVKSTTSKKKGLMDKWIEQLRNRGKRTVTEEQSLELATAAVKMSAMKSGIDTVCFVGCDLKAGAGTVCDKLKTALEKDKLKVTVLNNVLYDATAMEQLQDVKGVVLVEKAAVTMYREIAEELEFLKRQGILVLGGIVVE